MTVRIAGLTAAEYQDRIDRIVSRHRDLVPVELLPVPGSGVKAYVLRSSPRDENSRAVLCAWRGEWVSWVHSYATGELLWGRYGSDAEPGQAQRQAGL